MKTIDKTAALDAIRQKYGRRYCADPQAVAEAAALWGAVANEHGVLSSETETIGEVGRCRGQVHFHETGHGYWLIGITAESAISGVSYRPSIWCHAGYASRHDARLAGIEALIVFFYDMVRRRASPNSAANRAAARKLLYVLEDEKTPQLDLFG